MNKAGYTVSGQVTYYSYRQPVPGVLITLSGGENFYEAFTDENGMYLISGIRPGNYTAAPFYGNNPGIKGLSAEDVSEIERYVMGKTEPDEYQKIAADVTLNGSVSGMDSSRLVRYRVSLIEELNESNIHWIFEPDSAAVSVASDLENQDFILILLGDVTGNYQPEQQSRAKQRSREYVYGEEILYDIPEIYVTSGDTLSMPVVIDSETDIKGIDITVEFDKNVLNAAGVVLTGGILEKGNYKTVSNTGKDGKLMTAIFAAEDILADAGTVAFITFDVIGGLQSSSLINLSEFQCNENPASGGFYINGTASQAVRITVK